MSYFSLLWSRVPSLCSFFVTVSIWNILIFPFLEDQLHLSVETDFIRYIQHVFLVMLSVTFVLLSHAHVYKEEYLVGMLTWMNNNDVSILRYCIHTFFKDWMSYVVPLSFLVWGWHIILMSSCGWDFFMIILLLLTLSLLFSHLMSTLTLHQNDTLTLFNFVLIWPFLIPAILISFSLMNSQAALISLPCTEGIMLLGGIFLLSISLCFYFLLKSLRDL